MKSVKPSQCRVSDADINQILTPFFDGLKDAFVKPMGFHWEIRSNAKDGLYFAVMETIKQERTLKIVGSSYFPNEQVFYLSVVQVQHYLQPAQDGKKPLWLEPVDGKNADELAQSLAGQVAAVVAVCERFFGAELFDKNCLKDDSQVLSYDELAATAQEQAWQNFNHERLWEAAYLDGQEITADVSQEVFERFFAENYWFYADGSIFEKK